MPRFVILEHDHPHLHWDFMVEVGEVLWTWRLATPPRGVAEVIAAERIGDHRRDYLDYEGPLSGGRGCVTRQDWGAYEMLEATDSRLTLKLCGQGWTAAAVLEKLDPGWRLLWRPD